MNPALDGVTVVVTRPAAQSGRFIELARAAGATCIAYPTLQIEPLAIPPATLARLQAGRWDWAIFTSANAVAAAVALQAQPLAAKHAAVGRATARALEQPAWPWRRGQPTPHPKACSNSPSSPPASQVRPCCSSRAAVAATCWRPTLRARGAEVVELEVYRRVAVAPEAGAAAALHDALARSGDPRQPRVVVTVTSAEILQSLLAARAHGRRAQAATVPVAGAGPACRRRGVPPGLGRTRRAGADRRGRGDDRRVVAAGRGLAARCVIALVLPAPDGPMRR